MYTRAGDLLCRPVLGCAARERRSLPTFRRRGFSGLPLSERWSLPGPAPAGGPTSCAPKKSAEEGRSRGLPPVPLRNPREYLAITRRLPSLPTGTPAEGSIQVAGTPNNGCQKARRGLAAENNARSGRSRALRACAASPRSFPPPRGRCAPRKSGRVSPNALSVRFRRLAGRGIAPAARRLAGCCTPVR